MKLFVAHVTHPAKFGGNTAQLVVAASDADEVHKILHEDYGHAIVVTDVHETPFRSFQIGGNIFVVREN